MTFKSPFKYNIIETVRKFVEHNTPFIAYATGRAPTLGNSPWYKEAAEEQICQINAGSGWLRLKRRLLWLERGNGDS